MDIQRLLEYDWALYTKALRMCQPFDQITQLLEIHKKEMLTNVHDDAHYSIVYNSKTRQLPYKGLTK